MRIILIIFFLFDPLGLTGIFVCARDSTLSMFSIPFLYVEIGTIFHVCSRRRLRQVCDITLFTGMGSEQVATVLRQSGEAVRLIVARPVSDPGAYKGSEAAIIPTDTLDEYLDNLFYKLMEMDALMENAVVSFFAAMM